MLMKVTRLTAKQLETSFKCEDRLRVRTLQLTVEGFTYKVSCSHNKPSSEIIIPPKVCNPSWEQVLLSNQKLDVILLIIFA